VTAADSIRRSRPDVNTSRCPGGSTQKRDRIDAFGSTIILAPSCSFRMALEEHWLFHTACVAYPGLAIVVQSECQPTTSVRGSEAELTPMLSSDAQRMLIEENAGGSSRISEAMSFECLHRTFGARLLALEMELKYWPSNGSITDYAIEVDDAVLGVSVTRAMTKPGERLVTEAAAGLLRKKLNGVVRSTQECISHDLQKQILHVWVRTAEEAEVIKQAYANTIEPELASSTAVLVTVCGLSLLFDEKSRAPMARCGRLAKGAKDASHMRVLMESDPMRCNANLSGVCCHVGHEQ